MKKVPYVYIGISLIEREREREREREARVERKEEEEEKVRDLLRLTSFYYILHTVSIMHAMHKLSPPYISYALPLPTPTRYF